MKKDINYQRSRDGSGPADDAPRGVPQASSCARQAGKSGLSAFPPPRDSSRDAAPAGGMEGRGVQRKRPARHHILQAALLIIVWVTALCSCGRAGHPVRDADLVEESVVSPEKAPEEPPEEPPEKPPAKPPEKIPEKPGRNEFTSGKESEQLDQGGLPSPETGFEVCFLNVGQGDSALVSCDGHHMLIDGGNSSCSSLLYTSLREKGVRHLDYIVGTHPDEDHMGGLSGALNYATAGAAFCPVESDDSAAFEDFQKYLGRQNVRITVPSPGSEYPLGSAGLKFLGPREITDSDNDNSLVIKIVHGGSSFLFTGDAETGEERDIIESGEDISSRVLKISHHGSASSTSDAWLDAIRPEAAVISCGEGNAYGHPTESVLKRLRERNITVFRTDLQGDIIFYENGGELYWETERETHADLYFPGGTEPDGNDSGMEGQEVPGQEQRLIPSDSGAGPGNNTAESGTEGTVKTGKDDLPGDVPPERDVERDYVLNANTGKFHRTDCPSAARISRRNRRDITSTRQELILQGYQPCGYCRP